MKFDKAFVLSFYSYHKVSNHESEDYGIENQ
jgi:hypothetical protein